MTDNTIRKFTIRNSASGGGWYIGALEADLRAYCFGKGLSIAVFKSGWIFKYMSFTITGEDTTSNVHAIVGDLERIYARHE